MKTTEKVAFNIASEASYVSIDEACGQTVLPDRSLFIGHNLVENTKFKNSNATFGVIFKHSVQLNLQSLQTVKSTEGPIFKGVNFVVVEGPEKTKITRCKKISKNSIFKKLKIVNFNF